MPNDTNPEYWGQKEESMNGQITDDVSKSKSDAEGFGFTDEVIVAKVE